jgi:acyl-CoA reductase-like NAD-dependent aldehyde dehydrogenase
MYVALSRHRQSATVFYGAQDFGSVPENPGQRAEIRARFLEQFGPVSPLIKYRTVDEAIVRANALDVGMGGSVWANDTVEDVRITDRLDCGTAWVNQHGGLHPLAR